MPAFSHIETHEADAVDLLVSQYKGKANMEALASIIGAAAQSVEDAALLLVTERTLSSAVGAQLEGIGALVGEAREGRTDEVYRVFIRGRIKVNLSSGTCPQLQEIFDLLYSALGGNTVLLEEWYPCALGVQAHGATDEAIAQALANLLAEARAGGARGLFFWSPAADASTLTCGTYAESTSDGLDGETVVPCGSIAEEFPARGSLVLVDEASGETAATSYTRDATTVTLADAVPGTMTGRLFMVATLTGSGLSGPAATGTVAAGVMSCDQDLDAISFPASGSLILTTDTGATVVTTFTSRTGSAISGIASSYEGAAVACPSTPGGQVAGAKE